jgi:hypothetical protein
VAEGQPSATEALLSRCWRSPAQAIPGERQGRGPGIDWSWVDREIMDVEGRICDLLGLDMPTLWQRSGETPAFFNCAAVSQARSLRV